MSTLYDLFNDKLIFLYVDSVPNSSIEIGLCRATNYNSCHSLFLSLDLLSFNNFLPTTFRIRR